jgi:hypothetical protein
MQALTQTRVNACRQAARRLLKSFAVDAPDEIDLETIAWRAGRLQIRYGGLSNCDGRIIANVNGGGIIRVRRSPSVGRERFTIAHEIGHFVLHPAPNLQKDDGPPQFAMWHSDSEEVEANIFAAELLMPESLLLRATSKTDPSLALLDRVADRFQTSVLATAVQYTNYTQEQVALILSAGKTIQWSKPSRSFSYRIRSGELSPDSAAGERIAGKATDSGRMVVTPACAWLTQFEYDNEHDIMEDSRYLDYYDRTLSLLWLKEDLEE